MVEIVPEKPLQFNTFCLVERAGDFLIDTLRQIGIQVEEDFFNFEGFASRNIVGRLPGKTNPSSVVIIGAHYDSYAEPDSTESAPAPTIISLTASPSAPITRSAW